MNDHPNDAMGSNADIATVQDVAAVSRGVNSCGIEEYRICDETINHVAVVWTPWTRWPETDVETGDNWRACLTEHAGDIYLDEAFVVRPWEVRFEPHRQKEATCTDCDALYALQRASIIAMTGEPTDPRVIPVSRRVPDSPPLPYRPPASDPWTRPHSQIGLRIADLTVTAVVEPGRPHGEDWKGPLGEAAYGAVCGLIEAISEDRLMFAEI